MKILEIPSLSQPLPPVNYHGTNRVVWWLSEAFSALGHQVLLGGINGSASDQLSIIPTNTPIINAENRRAILNFFKQLRQNIPYKLDIIHSHLDQFSDELSQFFPESKIVTTIHGHHEKLPKTSQLVYISQSQKNEYAKIGERDGQVIYNPINTDTYQFKKEKQDYFLFMAKCDWKVKGVDLAIKVAEQCKVPLKICGPGLSREIQSRLPNDIEYLGEVTGDNKHQLLQNAKALLYPTQWAEPFGLAPVEANACGTPSIVLANGAMPEVIKHNVSGYLCHTMEDLCEAVKKIEAIQPEACRKWVEDMFDYKKIAAQYLDLFSQELSKV